jgi:hypothetical protein
MISLIHWARMPLGIASALLALTLGVGAVAAAPASTNSSSTTNHNLQRGLRTRQSQLQGAANQIALEDQYAAEVAASIATVKSQGRDVNDLENGLAQFGNRIAYSKAEWQSADALLSAHAGFDAQGNVVDKGQAKWTLDTSHDQLMQIKQSAKIAKNELNDLFSRYDRINKIHVDVPSTRDAF